MVVLWVLSGQQSRRCLDPQPLPFNNGKRMRRKVQMTFYSEEVLAFMKTIPYELKNEHVPFIFGAVDVSVGFIYSHMSDLDELDRAQYRHWQRLGVPGDEQWFFKFQSCAALPDPVQASHHQAKRFNRAFVVLKQQTVDELCSMMPHIPGWLAAERDVEYHLGVLVPEPFAVCYMQSMAQHVLVPSPKSRGWWRAEKWMLDMFNQGLIDAFQATRRPSPADVTGFSMTSCSALAGGLRRVLQDGLAGQEHMLFQWLCSLQKRDDQLHACQLPTRLAVFSQMIDLVMLADKLRDGGELQAVLRKALKVVMGPELEDFGEALLQQTRKMHKSQISRARLTMDVGFMLHKRVLNKQFPEKVRYLMWDSSPQFGRDYQMGLVQETQPQHLPRLLKSFLSLASAWQANHEGAVDWDFNNEELIAQTRANMSDIQQHVSVHALPAVLIGLGAASFQHKLWALLHAARLETFSQAELRDWASSIWTVASDYGVERLLSNLESVLAQDVTTWFEDTSDFDAGLLSAGPSPNLPDVPVARPLEVNAPFDDAFEDPQNAAVAVDDNYAGYAGDAFEEVPQPLEIRFPRLLGMAGLHHVIDNATKGFADVLHKYKDYVFLAQQVCRLLRKRDTRPKLLQRCFSRGVGPQLAEDIKKFQGWINPGRWGTVAFSLPEILKVKQSLTWGWDEAIFLRGEEDAGQENRRATAELAQQISAAVHNPLWWAWVAMMEVVCALIRRHIAFVESCPCHWHLLEQARRGEIHIPQEVKALFETCPMRGKRAAEISSGAFLDILKDLWAVSAAEVVRVMGRDINEEDKRFVMQEFDRARAHLVFYFTLKLSHLQEFPWKILQIAHPSEIVAQMAARDALQSTCQHPLVVELQGSLRPSCESWLEGESLMTVDKQDLQTFIGALCIVPTSERAIEGQHAKVHRHGLGKPNHTEHFQSYFVRSKEIAEGIESGNMPLEKFAWYCQAARNHHAACAAVGLSGHPSLQAEGMVRRRQDPMRSKVIYHADPFSLYAADGPPVNMKPSGSGNALAIGGMGPNVVEDGHAPAVDDRRGRFLLCAANTHLTRVTCFL